MFVDEKALGESQEVQQRITRLSQAIREGCKVAPRQITGSYTDGAGGACALGAAMIAMDINACDPDAWRDMRIAFGLKNRLHRKITERNDNWKMTREAIADWLEARGL